MKEGQKRGVVDLVDKMQDVARYFLLPAGERLITSSVFIASYILTVWYICLIYLSVDMVYVQYESSLI